MQKLWYYLLRSYVQVGLFFFYDKIIVRGYDALPKGPILFTPNHQNAFMDALLVVCTNHRSTHFLARADIFQKKWARWLLQSMQLLPVYRMRDGFENLGQNQQTFDRVSSIFARGDSVIIFPEGNHGSQRRLRPLSKGFTRLIIDFLHKHPGQTLHVVPVGLNYSSPTAFRSSVCIIYGEALSITSLAAEEIKQAGLWRDQISQRLKKIMTHVEDAARYEEVIQAIQATPEEFLHPEEVNLRIKKVEDGSHTTPALPIKKPQTSVLYLVWQVIHGPVLLIWKMFRQKIKDPVFIASLKFLTGLFLFPLYFAILLLAGWSVGFTGVGLGIILFSLLLTLLIKLS
jgi:1-acyl-sn-glycerol-3-phosphate acyltransferase